MARYSVPDAWAAATGWSGLSPPVRWEYVQAYGEYMGRPLLPSRNRLYVGLPGGSDLSELGRVWALGLGPDFEPHVVTEVPEEDDNQWKRAGVQKGMRWVAFAKVPENGTGSGRRPRLTLVDAASPEELGAAVEAAPSFFVFED